MELLGFGNMQMIWLLLLAGDVLPVGVWESAEYGVVFEVGREKVRQYEVLPGYCLLAEEVKAAENPYREWEPRGEAWTMGTIVVRPGKIPEKCATKRDPDAARSFGVLEQTFRRHYAFLDRRGKGWEAGKAKVKQSLAGDWFPAACEWLESLGDSHVSLSDGKRDCGRGRDPRVDGEARALAARDALLRTDGPLTGPAKPRANRRIWTARLREDPTVGYLNLFTMGGFVAGRTSTSSMGEQVRVFAKEMDEILANEMKGTRAMVVDLRYNLGGFDQVGLELASRFATKEYTAYTKQVFLDGKLKEPLAIRVSPSRGVRYEGRVVVLVGPVTVSAGEAAALALAGLPQVTLAGSETEGAFSDALERKLPNGWSFTLSNEVYTSPDGKVFEGTGIPPARRVAGDGFGDAIAEALRILRS
jgi:hypothetical protein